jgi:hypothetical protein
MAAVAITTQLLVLNTRGEDDPDGAAGSGAANNLVLTVAADGWVVSPPSGGTFDERLIFRLMVTTAATIVFTAGDRYPAQRADLGNLSITMATNDSRMICVETSRFLQNDGTIVVTGTNTTDRLAAYMVPKAA